MSASSFPQFTGVVATGNIADQAVTNQKLEQVATGTIKSNLTAGTAYPADNTLAAVAQAIATSANPVMLLGKTGAIDYLATGTHAIDLPVIAGKTALAAVSRFSITARTGTATGTLIYNVGNDGPVTNMFPGFSLAASLANATVSAIPFSILGGSSGGMVDIGTTALSFNISTAFTGATVLAGKFYLAIWYV